MPPAGTPASDADLACLAMDGGPVPEQFGALLRGRIPQPSSGNIGRLKPAPVSSQMPFKKG